MLNHVTKPRSLGSPKWFKNPSLVHAQGRGCPRGLMTSIAETETQQWQGGVGRTWRLRAEHGNCECRPTTVRRTYHVEDKEKIKTKLGLRTSSLLRGSRSLGFKLDGKMISMKRGQTPFQTRVSSGLKVTPIYIQLGVRRSEVENRTEGSTNLSY